MTAYDTCNNAKVVRKKWYSSHYGPLSRNDPSYSGSLYNIMVEWENGETTYEPLSVITANDPVMCAMYAREQSILKLHGWKRFKGITKWEKKNQAKLKSFCMAPKYMFGYVIPKDYNHVMEFDCRNGNTKWQDCKTLELDQLAEYKAFLDYGHKELVQFTTYWVQED